jgi:hypothetical protein
MKKIGKTVATIAVVASLGMSGSATAANAAPAVRHHLVRVVKSLTKAEERKATKIIQAMDRTVMANDRRHARYLGRHVMPRNVSTTNYYAGYGDFQASSGVTFIWTTGNYQVPTVNCADISYYKTDPDYIFTWYGIGAGGFVAQAGSLVVCNNNKTLQGVNDWYTIQGGDSVYYSDLDTAMGDSLTATICAPDAASGVGPCPVRPLSEINDYSFVLEDNTSGEQWINLLICPSVTTCSDQDTDAYMEQPTGYNVAGFSYPNGYGFSGTEVETSDGTVGSLSAISGEWTSASISIENSNGRVLVAPGTLDETYPPTGDSFSPVFRACC